MVNGDSQSCTSQSRTPPCHAHRSMGALYVSPRAHISRCSTSTYGQWSWKMKPLQGHERQYEQDLAFTGNGVPNSDMDNFADLSDGDFLIVKNRFKALLPKYGTLWRSMIDKKQDHTSDSDDSEEYSNEHGCKEGCCRPTTTSFLPTYLIEQPASVDDENLSLQRINLAESSDNNSIQSPISLDSRKSMRSHKSSGLKVGDLWCESSDEDGSRSNGEQSTSVTEKHHSPIDLEKLSSRSINSRKSITLGCTEIPAYFEVETEACFDHTTENHDSADIGNFLPTMENKPSPVCDTNQSGSHNISEQKREEFSSDSSNDDGSSSDSSESTRVRWDDWKSPEECLAETSETFPKAQDGLLIPKTSPKSGSYRSPDTGIDALEKTQGQHGDSTKQYGLAPMGAGDLSLNHNSSTSEAYQTPLADIALDISEKVKDQCDDSVHGSGSLALQNSSLDSNDQSLNQTSPGEQEYWSPDTSVVKDTPETERDHRDYKVDDVGAPQSLSSGKKEQKLDVIDLVSSSDDEREYDARRAIIQQRSQFVESMNTDEDNGRCSSETEDDSFAMNQSKNHMTKKNRLFEGLKETIATKQSQEEVLARSSKVAVVNLMSSSEDESEKFTKPIKERSKSTQFSRDLESTARDEEYKWRGTGDLSDDDPIAFLTNRTNKLVIDGNDDQSDEDAIIGRGNTFAVEQKSDSGQSFEIIDSDDEEQRCGNKSPFRGRRGNSLTDRTNSLAIHDSDESVNYESPKKKRGQRTISFKRRRHDLSQELFVKFDKAMTNGRLGSCTTVEWSNKLRTTAGLTRLFKRRNGFEYDRIAVIELSTKVVDEEDRLRDTLLHELCHAAAFVIDGVTKPPHGKCFKKWAKLAMARIPGTSVTTTHDYEIQFKYAWGCTSQDCDFVVQRHSRSVDVKKHICPLCRSSLVEIDVQRSGRSTKKERKKQAPSAYNLFVKEHFSSVRQRLVDEGQSVSQAQIMKECSQLWRTLNQKETE